MSAPDDVEFDHDFTKGAEAAIEAQYDLYDRAEEDGFDPIGAGFSLWIELLVDLLDAGWKPEELKKEIEYYSRRNMN